MRSIKRKLFDLIPAYSNFLFQFCQRYVDRYNGDNNSDPVLNGEEMFLRRTLPGFQNGIVFDVGANIGDWAKYALTVEPSVQLHCFEPSHATYKQLHTNVWPKNVYLNNFGLGEYEGQLELNIVHPSAGVNSIYMRHGLDRVQMTSKELIEISTIDTYCTQHNINYVHLLKIDVEGHELAVLKGAQRMLSQKAIKMIQFEYGGCNLDARVYLLDIWSFLEPFGFKLFKLFPEGPRQIERYLQSFESFRYSNWLAILD